VGTHTRTPLLPCGRHAGATGFLSAVSGAWRLPQARIFRGSGRPIEDGGQEKLGGEDRSPTTGMRGAGYLPHAPFPAPHMACGTRALVRGLKAIVPCATPLQLRLSPHCRRKVPRVPLSATESFASPLWRGCAGPSQGCTKSLVGSGSAVASSSRKKRGAIEGETAWRRE